VKHDGAEQTTLSASPREDVIYVINPIRFPRLCDLCTNKIILRRGAEGLLIEERAVLNNGNFLERVNITMQRTL
jgi:hypothetical protein